MAQILPSIFGADILRLQDEIKFLEDEQTEILHVDLMDGTYVSNIAFGPNQIAAMKKASTMIFDVHMMLANPERHIDDVIKAEQKIPNLDEMLEKAINDVKKVIIK